MQGLPMPGQILRTEKMLKKRYRLDKENIIVQHALSVPAFIIGMI